MAALDCSTKSRAHEIPVHFADGHPGPQPLRSAEFPEGLPNLPSRDAARVQRDNFAAGFVLDEIHDLAQRGGATVRENPGRNLHWELPREKDLMDTGLYYDTEYSACVFQSARCKYQRLRHNVWEITLNGLEQCVPIRAFLGVGTMNGRWGSHLSFKRKAAYSAGLAFALAVSLSWWAVRVGRAILHVPRLPPMDAVGRREHWLDLHPQSMRSWAMAPMAILLGLEPPDPQERARIPPKGRVSTFLVDGALPDGVIYVGQGHHSHRLPTTSWICPFCCWAPLCR